MRNYRVVFKGNAGMVAVRELEAKEFDIIKGVLSFYDDEGFIVSVFNSWLRIDRVH